MSATFNEKAYTLLVAFGQGLGTEQGKVDKAKAKLAETKEKAALPYTNAVLAAIECRGDAAVLKATFEHFFANVRKNVGGMAVKMKAKRRDEKSDNGDTHTIPSSLSTAKTVLVFALERGVPLIIDGEQRSYGSLRDEKRDILAEDAKKEAAEAEAKRLATAEPDELARIAAVNACERLLGAVPHMSEAWAHEVTKFCENAIAESIKESAALADAVAKAAKAVYDGETGSGEELADALAARREKKRPGRRSAQAMVA